MPDYSTLKDANCEDTKHEVRCAKYMDINYLGHSSVKIKGKSSSLIIDPFNPENMGLKWRKESADILLISHDHSDHNFEEGVDGVKKVIRYPGEYEVAGVSILGFSTYHDDKKGEERGNNVIYKIEMEKISLLHLGDLGHELKKDLVDDIGVIDILFIPVGGIYTIGPKEAQSIVNALTPKIIIPIHYKTDKHNKEMFDALSEVNEFVELTGLKAENLPKLSIKQENLSEDQTRLVILDGQ